MRRRICWLVVFIAPSSLAYVLVPLLSDPLLYLALLFVGSCGLIAAALLLGLVVEPLSRYLNCCGWRFAGFPIFFAFATPITFGLNTIASIIVLGLLFVGAVAISRYCCCHDIYSALIHATAVWFIWGVIIVLASMLRGVL